MFAIKLSVHCIIVAVIIALEGLSLHIHSQNPPTNASMCPSRCQRSASVTFERYPARLASAQLLLDSLSSVVQWGGKKGRRQCHWTMSFFPKAPQLQHQRLQRRPEGWPFMCPHSRAYGLGEGDARRPPGDPIISQLHVHVPRSRQVSRPPTCSIAPAVLCLRYCA